MSKARVLLDTLVPSGTSATNVTGNITGNAATATSVSGTIGIGNGGTGQTNAAAARTALGAAPLTVGISNKTAAYTVVATDAGSVINCTSGAWTLSLTAAATLGAGFNVEVWNTSNTATDVITIDPNAAETVDGLATIVLRRGEGVQLICDGTNWQTGDAKKIRMYSENFAATDARPTASGTGSIAIGGSSTASGNYSFAGLMSQAIGVGSTAFGGSGTANTYVQANGAYSLAIGLNSGANGSVTAVNANGAVALGGSYASGADSFAAAIANNTNTYGAQGTNSVAIGYLAKTSGTYSTAIGRGTVASGTDSGVLASQNSTASGVSSVVVGGANSTASATYSAAFGWQANAAFYGKQAFASGQFSTLGDAQAGKMILRAATSAATATIMTSDGAAASSTNQVILQNDSTVGFKGMMVVRNTANDADSKVWEFKGAIRRGVAAANTALIGTPVIDILASDGSAYTFTLTADTTNGGLAITVTGAAATSLRWVCTIDTTEVIG